MVAVFKSVLLLLLAAIKQIWNFAMRFEKVVMMNFYGSVTMFINQNQRQQLDVEPSQQVACMD